MIDIVQILTAIDDVMYYPILIIIMAAAGLYFTARTKGVQIRLFPESVRILLEPPDKEGSVSSLQAMLVSTASRVGTGKHHWRFYSNLSWRSRSLFLDVANVSYWCILRIH